MQIMVTGGAGFIGSNLTDALIQLGHNVSIVDNISTGKREYVNPKAALYEVDINSSILDEVFDEIKPEVIYHHAAQVNVTKSVQNPSIDAEINIQGTINLLKNCIKSNVKKIVYASSAAVYGPPLYLPIDEEHIKNPLSFYGVSKLTPEHYIKIYNQLYDLDYTIFRYANVFGPRQDYIGEGGVVSIFINKILQNDIPIIYGDGNQTRDFIYVKDIINANIAAIDMGSKSTYNISTNKTTTLNELLNEITALSKKKITPIFEKTRLGDIRDSCLNNTKALSELAWKPTFSLIDGLKETINYYTRNGHTNDN